MGAPVYAGQRRHALPCGLSPGQATGEFHSLQRRVAPCAMQCGCACSDRSATGSQATSPKFSTTPNLTSPSRAERRASADSSIGARRVSKRAPHAPSTSRCIAPGPRRDAKSTLVCILPKDAPAEEEFKISQPGLELRINHPVRFQPYYSTRHDGDKSGTLVPWNESDFHRLPPLQTIAKLDDPRSRN